MNSFFSYKIDVDLKLRNLIVCYCSGYEFPIESFFTEIRKQFNSTLFSRDILIIAPNFNKSEISRKLLRNTRNINKLKEKINLHQELNIHYYFIDYTKNTNAELIPENQSPRQRKITEDEIDKIINHGIKKILKERNLIIKANPFYHFITPSGMHTREFIRVSNALEKGPEISFLALNLVKTLPNKLSKIYVDTPGIYPLAYELSNLASKFSGNNPAKIDSFGSHFGIENYNFLPDGETLFLISACTSNKLVEKIHSKQPINSSKIVTVINSCSYAKSIDSLVDLNDYFQKYDDDYFHPSVLYPENQCPMCLSESSIAIPLSKNNFSFEPPKTEQYLPLASDSYSNLKKMMSSYKSSEVFRCLFDGLDGTKQPTPEYFIDVTKLIKENENFQTATNRFIQRHFPLNVDLIIYCNDEGAKDLAEYIHKTVSSLGLETSLEKEIEDSKAEPQKGIAVVAGSIQTGKALLNISRSLRQYGDLPVTYIIGFAKYQSTESYNKLVKDLTYSSGPNGNHHLYSIEKILLPINEHRQTSWEKELDVLIEMIAEYDTSPKIINELSTRQDTLRNATTTLNKGIGDDLFLKSPKGKRLVLGATFAFWNTSDTDTSHDHQGNIYYTISSILQKLRTVPNNCGTPPLGKGHTVKQLNPLLFDRFNEGVIQASFLRGAKSRELDFSGDDDSSKILGSLIERMFNNPEARESEALPEFLLALCTGRLQIKKDHLHFLNSNNINKEELPMLWAFTNYSAKVLFEDGNDMGIPF